MAKKKPEEGPVIVPKGLADLRQRFLDAADAVHSAEEVLKEKKAALLGLEMGASEVLKDNDCPEGFTFPDGARIVPEQRIHVSVTKANEAAAHRWLIESGFGALVKTTASVEFGKDEYALAMTLAEFCATVLPGCDITIVPGAHDEAVRTAILGFMERALPGHVLVLETTVNANALRSFVAKRLKDGKTMPEAFGVFAPNVVTLREPKAKGEDKVDF